MYPVQRVENIGLPLKYERLPTICFICGRIGHDVKHCSETTNWQEADKQYGEWMKAGWNSKGGPSRTQTTSSKDQAVADIGIGGVGSCAPTDNSSIPELVGLGGNNIFDENPALGNVPYVNVATNQIALLLQVAENQDGWDRAGKLKRNQKAKENPRDQQEKMIFGSSQDPKKDKRDACSIVGQPQLSNSKAQEVTSPLRPKLERK